MPSRRGIHPQYIYGATTAEDYIASIWAENEAVQPPKPRRKRAKPHNPLYLMGLVELLESAGPERAEKWLKRRK